MAPLSISHFVMQLKLHHFEYRVGFIFDKEKGFVMSRVRSKADGRRTVQSLMKFSLIGRSFESAQFKLQRPSTLKKTDHNLRKLISENSENFPMPNLCGEG